jgi:serine/arginine repetitive matrix protein 1
MYSHALRGALCLANHAAQPKIKELQIALTGFLDKDCAPFCKELWNLLLSAQENPMGVPQVLIEAKKVELEQQQVC